MKKLLLLTLMFSGFASLAQTHHCAIDEYRRNLYFTNPAFAERVNDFERIVAQRQLRRDVADNDEIYVVPVVLHILHKGEPLGTGFNIPDEEIFKVIEAANLRLRKVAGSVGDGTGVDTHIQLALASRDPLGQCTNGIVRVDMSDNQEYMDYGVGYYSENGLLHEDLLAASPAWNINSYFNLYVITEYDGGAATIGGDATLEYARIKSSVFRSIDSSIFVHELGHTLSLYHTFEGSTGFECPAVVNGCGYGEGDCCGDTPPQIGPTSCFLPDGNACDNNNTVDQNYIRNYMGYSDNLCHNMFSAQQALRMRTDLETQKPGYLAQNGSLALVSPSAPQAAFSVASGGVACTDGIVRLYDNSTCTSNTYLFNEDMPGTTFQWTISNGSNTYTSVKQNPEFAAAAGTYDVSLTITTLNGSDTRTEYGFLVVGAPASAQCTPNIPFTGPTDLAINFVSFNTLNNGTSSRVNEGYRDFTCTHNTLVTAGQTYPLSVSTMGTAFDALSFIVMIDYNDDDTFSPEEIVMSGMNAMDDIPNEIFTGNITIPSTAIQNKLLTMRVMAAGYQESITPEQRTCQATITLGDVEDYGVYVQGTASALGNDKPALSLYPNPVASVFTITSVTVIKSLSIYNMLGQAVFDKDVNSPQPSVDVSHLSPGSYIIRVKAMEETSIIKIIKK